VTADHDLIVLGAGPAGASAAIEADALGLKTLLIDEQDAAGGQVWQAPTPAARPSGETEGETLRRRLAASGVRTAFSQRVWHIEPGFVVSTAGTGGTASIRAPALILATGAIERHVPLPGWTLPGVIGLGAATTFLKAQGVLPGRRVVVAGVGPLLFQVAALVLAAGGAIAAVVDLNSRTEWLAQTGGLATRPDLLWKGFSWLARIRASGVPVLSRHALRRIDGRDGVESVVAGPVDADWAPLAQQERSFHCDAVCLGFGLLPLSDATRFLGARHVYEPALGGWTVESNADQQTSVAQLYACGDGAGILGAAAAPLRGRIAALAAARDLGRLTQAQFDQQVRPLRRQLAWTTRFGLAMTQLTMPRPGLLQAITPETVVCRCEAVTRAKLDQAIGDGAVTINDLKSATRCGMGPCGGRSCEDAAAALIAARTGHAREWIGTGTARAPLRPLPLDALLGDFDYERLPIPAPAPL
jgi:thioredoxin reductase/bacterioferritin-associated ferredoxin